MATTWLSILSPVSWFLIFKGQAYVHTFTNYLAWHMPFTLFGYAMCAYLVRSMALTLSAASPDPRRIPHKSNSLSAASQACPLHRLIRSRMSR